MQKNDPNNNRKDEFRPFSSQEFYPYPIYEPDPVENELFPPAEEEIDYWSVDNDFHL